MLAAGFLFAGMAAAWLVFRSRTKLLEEQARAESAAAAARIADRDQQLDEMRDEIALLRQEANALRDRLQGETGKRTAAEERNSRIAELERDLAEKNLALESLHTEKSEARATIAGLETRLVEERKRAEEKLVLLVEARDQLKIQFQNLAQEIFEEKGKKFTEQNRTNIDGVLKPVREQLAEFKKRIEDVYEKESRDRVSLFHEIGALKALNQRISEDAINLTNALKGQSKTQGIWGEVILERILEESGLRKGREYESQGSFAGEQGRQARPDVVVHLPDDKDVVIDSKVSLVAYERFSSAGNEEERQQHLKAHVASIRAHVKGLSDKNYGDLAGVRSLDFVLMFLPIEGAFMAAIDSDAALFNEAFSKNILLVSPTTLLATLRTIQNIWRYEYQNRNAVEIAGKAASLYDKFVGFVESLEEIGHRIGQARDAYDTARNRLVSGRGNLVRQVQDLELLGVKARKSLPESLVGEAGEDRTGH